MSQELLQLLERHRELGAAGEMVDVFPGNRVDRRLRQARTPVGGYSLRLLLRSIAREQPRTIGFVEQERGSRLASIDVKG
jgi:hypothetical protein